jgi:chorismate lyase / 3-hydroxybenzoate synthase
MHLLARVQFGAVPAGPDDARHVHVPLHALADQASEYWLSPTPVQHGWHGTVAYAENGAVLLAHVQVSHEQIQQDGLEQSVYQAYTDLQALSCARGYGRVLRIWNFLEQITAGQGDAERYRIFNLGRARALAAQPQWLVPLPAATAIGLPEGGFLLYCLAAREAVGMAVENPRQVPAFEYPRQYGPQSPSFSRATRVEWADGGELLVSGTASVVGHCSHHPGDALAQLQEVFINIEHVLAHAAHQRGVAHYRAECLKLYLQTTDRAQELKALVAARYGTDTLLCLEGDICRNDLLLEIEGVFLTP